MSFADPKWDIPPKVKYFGFEKAMKLLKKGYTVCFYNNENGSIKKFKFFNSSLKRGGCEEKNCLMDDAGGDKLFRTFYLAVDDIFSKNWFKLPKSIMKITKPEECPYRNDAKKCDKDRLVDCRNCKIFPEECPLNRWIR